jgi:hypothetical protein
MKQGVARSMFVQPEDLEFPDLDEPASNKTMMMDANLLEIRRVIDQSVRDETSEEIADLSRFCIDLHQLMLVVFVYGLVPDRGASG